MKILIESIGKVQNDYLLNIKKGKEIWLTESRLKNILHELFPKQEIISNKQIIISTKKFFPDYRIQSKKIIVEFQGCQHFTSSKIVYKDSIRKKLFENEGYTFIEIPYFIQLTENVIEKLFPMVDLKDFTLPFYPYPHGFVHPKSVVPGDFCIKGLDKYVELLSCYPDEVVHDIDRSLELRAKFDDVPIEVYNPLYVK